MIDLFVKHLSHYATLFFGPNFNIEVHTEGPMSEVRLTTYIKTLCFNNLFYISDDMDRNQIKKSARTAIRANIDTVTDTEFHIKELI